MAEIEIDTKPLLYDIGVITEDDGRRGMGLWLELAYVPAVGDTLIVTVERVRSDLERATKFWPPRTVETVEFLVKHRRWDTRTATDKPSVELTVERVQER